MNEHDPDRRIDDCWNRIGVRGDRSCPRLAALAHCHHCEVHAETAKRILDLYPLREMADTAPEPDIANETSRDAESVLVFRLGEDWLGLPLALLIEVSPLQPVHSLPHRRSEAVLGVSHVRGRLAACISLATVLGLQAGAPALSGRSVPRMLVIGNEREGQVACPVDEVDGVHAVPRAALARGGDSTFGRAFFQCRDRSVCLLDEHRLLQAIDRSLA